MSDKESPADEYENSADEIQEYLKENDPNGIHDTEEWEIDEDENYHFAYEAESLGICPEDLAEIGGFPIKFAREVLSCNAPFPGEVATAIELIESDFNEIVDLLSELDELPLYSTTAELRSSLDIWPARGKSGGGFIGIHRKAVIEAHEISGAPINEITYSQE